MSVNMQQIAAFASLVKFPKGNGAKLSVPSSLAALIQNLVIFASVIGVATELHISAIQAV